MPKSFLSRIKALSLGVYATAISLPFTAVARWRAGGSSLGDAVLYAWATIIVLSEVMGAILLFPFLGFMAIPTAVLIVAILGAVYGLRS